MEKTKEGMTELDVFDIIHLQYCVWTAQTQIEEHIKSLQKAGFSKEDAEREYADNKKAAQQFSTLLQHCIDNRLNLVTKPRRD